MVTCTRNGRFGPLAALLLMAVSLVSYSESAAIPEPSHCTRSCRCYLQENQFAANCTSLSGISSISKRLEVLRLTRFDDQLSIKPGAFSQLPNLRELHLDHLSLVKVYPGAFKSLESLEVLDLADNSLSVGTEVAKAVRGLTNLRRLILRGNNFGGEHAQIPILASRSLKFLDLGRCKLRNLPPQVFTNLHHLRHIVLSGNFIRRFNASAFPPSVVSIDLSNNDIEFISKSELMKLDKVDTIELAENPIHCNCELLKISYDYNMEKAVVCAYPKQLMGKNLVDLTKQQLCGGKCPHGNKQKRQAENEIGDAEGEVLSEDEVEEDLDAEPSEAHLDNDKVRHVHTELDNEDEGDNIMDADINDGHEDENDFREPLLSETSIAESEGKEEYDEDEEKNRGREVHETDAAENTDILPDEFDGVDEDDDSAPDINSDLGKSHSIKDDVDDERYENARNPENHKDDFHERKNTEYNEHKSSENKFHAKEHEYKAETGLHEYIEEAEEERGIPAAEDPEEEKNVEDAVDIDYEEADIPIIALESRAESGNALKATSSEGENPSAKSPEDDSKMTDVHENVGKETFGNLGSQPEETPDEADNDDSADRKTDHLDEHDDVETVHDNENIVRTSDVGARTEDSIPSSEIQKESNIQHENEVEGSGENILPGVNEDISNKKDTLFHVNTEKLDAENVEDEEDGVHLKDGDKILSKSHTDNEEVGSEETNNDSGFKNDLKEDYEEGSELEARKKVEKLIESVENKKEDSHDVSTEHVFESENVDNSEKDNVKPMIGGKIINKEMDEYEEYIANEEKIEDSNNEVKSENDKSVSATGEQGLDKSLKEGGRYLVPMNVFDYEYDELNITTEPPTTKKSDIPSPLPEQDDTYDDNIIPGHNIPRNFENADENTMLTEEKDYKDQVDDFADAENVAVPEETPLNSWGSADENVEDSIGNKESPHHAFSEDDEEVEIVATNSQEQPKQPGASSVMLPSDDIEGSGSEVEYDDDIDLDSEVPKHPRPTTPEPNDYEDDIRVTEPERKISPEGHGHNSSVYEDEDVSGSQVFSEVARVLYPDVLDEDLSNETEAGSGMWPAPDIIMRKEHHPKIWSEDDDVYEGSGFIPVTDKVAPKDVSSEVGVVEYPESEHPIESPVDYDDPFDTKDTTTLKPAEERPIFPDRNIPQFALPPQNEDEHREEESVEEGSEEPPTVMTERNWREGKALAPIAASAPTGTVQEAPPGDTEGNKAQEESQNNAGSYVVLGVIMAIIVLLLAYAVVRSRRQKSAANKDKDAENPGREMQDVSKPLINNHNHAPEKQPLDETQEPLMTPKEKEASLTIDPSENGQKPVIDEDSKRKSRPEPNGDVPEVLVEPTTTPHIAATPTEDQEERPATPPGHTNGSAVPVANGGPPSPPPSPVTPPPQSSPSQPQPISPGAVRVVAKELPDSVAKRPVIIVNRGADQQQV